MGPPKGRRAKNYVKSKAHGGTGGGGAGENLKMNEQLAALELKVVPVTGDGNCFFRAIADQLEGNEEEHAKYRGMVVDFLQDHKGDFEPFLEEEITFDEYCSNMRLDGTWAGHMELQATSLVTKCDICIHRVMFPRWQILNFQSPGTPVLQLSYHGEEHYNSVRRIDDPGVGPPKLETIKVEQNLVNDLPPAKDAKEDGSQGRGSNKDAAAVKCVMDGSGCVDEVHVTQVLRDMHDDTDAAIEFLIAERNRCEDSDSSTDLMSLGESRTVNGEQVDTSLLEKDQEMGIADADRLASVASAATEPRTMASRVKNVALHPAQAVSRNKRCPCGSKKKYKACCGAVQGKAGVTFLSSTHGVVATRTRKERPRAAKSSVQVKPEEPTYPKEHDLGVLCI